MASHTILIFLASMLGCHREPDPSNHVKHLFLHQPDKVGPYIQSLTEAEQIYVVTQLSEEIPQRIQPLCRHVTGAPKERCLRITNRPHLWTSSQSSSSLPPTDSGCIHPNLCAEKKATRAIKQQQLELAVRECSQMTSEKWKDECIFHISEVLFEQGFSHYPNVLTLCQQSQSFRSHCLQHSVFSVVTYSLQQNHGIEEFSSLAEEFYQYWHAFDPQESHIRRDQLWSHWIYRQREADPEAVLDIPHPWKHHLHSSIALEGVRYGENLETDMATHLKNLQEKSPSRNRTPRGVDPTRNLWSESSFDSGVFLGFSQRIIDADPQIDLLLATLESIARLQPPQKQLLLPYRNHPHPKVAATSRRLLQVHSDYEYVPLLSVQNAN